MAESAFCRLSEDVLLNIFLKLEEDPRNWARLACVCTRFSALIRNVCCRTKCSLSIPSIVSDLLSGGCAAPPGGWSSLLKLSVCCPGLLHAGVLLENSDFGLERDIGPDHNYVNVQSQFPSQNPPQEPPTSLPLDASTVANSAIAECSWSLFDDLYLDTVYDASESQVASPSELDKVSPVASGGFSVRKRRKIKCKSVDTHLASSVWNLSRERGSKLLASRFRGDCLYICDWPGCVHSEEKRNYMLFRGVFKNFKLSGVWRTINDTNRSKISLECAFCPCKETWDLHSAFCLKRFFGYHDDGEPVVRAFVCENGHVSGAWTNRPLYT